jgi:hypothetical protein
MELGAKFPNGFLYRAASHSAFLDLPGTMVKDFLPSRLGVSIHGTIKAGDELAGQIGPVLFRQGQHLGNFFSGYAHAGKISPFPVA